MLSPNRLILYVDDDEDSCEMIGLMLHLEDNNYQVITVSAVGRALDLMRKQSFDLYIFDYALPEMTGVELCRTIRQTDSQTPVLLFSAMAREIDKAEALAAGANEYLVKPDDLERFTEVTRRLLNGNPAISRVEFSNKTAAPNFLF